MKIALGHLGWSEREYFTSSPESVYYAFQGYFDKRKHEERLFRNIAWISYKTGGGKEKNINSFWPIDEVKKEDVKVWGSKEEKDDLLKKIMEAHKINLNV